MSDFTDVLVDSQMIDVQVSDFVPAIEFLSFGALDFENANNSQYIGVI